MTKRKTTTELICTIGPTSRSKEVLRGLIKAGTDGLRINMSHTSPEEAILIMKDIRSISKTVPIIIDTRGKETRLRSAQGSMELKTKQLVKIGHEDQPSNATLLFSRPEIFSVLKVGDRFTVDDNAVELGVKTISPKTGVLIALVRRGGTLQSAKNIKLAKPFAPTNPLTSNDIAALTSGRKYKISQMALSYVTHASDVNKVRKIAGPGIAMVSKIETKAAIKDLDGIIEASDAISIDRNDLGTEIGYEKIPLIQKFILKRSQKIGKPAYVATHLLESMLSKNKPTRGEVNDIINTVLDGATGLVLSSETSVGKDPVNIFKTLQRLVTQAEFVLRKRRNGTVDELIERLEELNYV